MSKFLTYINEVLESLDIPTIPVKKLNDPLKTRRQNKKTKQKSISQ